MNISQGGCEHGGAVLREMLSVFCRQQRLWCCFYQQIVACTVPSSSTPRRCFQGACTVIFTSGSFGAVVVNLLFAQYRPGWMHLLATANYPRVMCFKNCLCLHPTGSFQGNSEKRWLFFVVSEGCGAAFTSKPLPAHYCPMWLHVTDFKELGPVYVASGSLGAVFVNLLYALFRPGWMHLHATVRSPRVMCLTNCLFLIPNGLF